MTTITYAYDELGRPVHRAINGVDSAMTFDAAGRRTGVTNALGTFAYGYDGSTARPVSKFSSQRPDRSGGAMATSPGRTLQRITTRWSDAGVRVSSMTTMLPRVESPRGPSKRAPSRHPSTPSATDAVNQLLSATATSARNSGQHVCLQLRPRRQSADRTSRRIELHRQLQRAESDQHTTAPAARAPMNGMSWIASWPSLLETNAHELRTTVLAGGWAFDNW
jgi:YD repeat-containing protein